MELIFKGRVDIPYHPWRTYEGVSLLLHSWHYTILSSLPWKTMEPFIAMEIGKGLPNWCQFSELRLTWGNDLIWGRGILRRKVISRLIQQGLLIYKYVLFFALCQKGSSLSINDWLFVVLLHGQFQDVMSRIK